MSNSKTNTNPRETKSESRSLFSRVRINIISYGYAQVVTLLAQLVLVPFFLKYWGAELYADWLVLTGIPSMLVLLDLGVSQASANRATMLAGAQNPHGVCCSLQTALAFTLLLIASVLLAALIVNQEISWVNILRLSKLEQHQASTIMLIMSAYLCVTLLGGPLDGWFKAIDQTATGAFLLANRRMADIIVSIFVLVMGGDSIDLATAMLACQLTILIILVVIARALSPWPVLGLSHASWNEFRRIWKPATAYAGFPLAQVITLQGGVQILNQVSTPTIVVGFTMARTMMRLIIQLGVILNNALKPEISRLAGRGEIDKAKKITLRASVGTLLLSSIIYISAIIAGPQIIDWWGHGKIQTDSTTLSLVGLHTLLNIAWFIPAALLIATNKHISTAGIYGASSFLAFLLWANFAKSIPPIIGASFLLAAPELAVLVFLLFKFYTRSPKILSNF
ncbi:lipopolysaccharide biosynthesis protein [Stutzerimonas stutzeri]|uniref:lipopolysaccharide biosynthesis protein n=1 Tax=Stutzerimonas stutzeri TaxID=316 RepID=UPI0024B6E508|nr:hypothetical protein [Stutzerimonas stutzeri]MDI9728290.1 hypothetical protein [Stutzerimonas stutzeri]MDI9749130.1 hypothetical protein [Stutzerimonas stutzeri]